MIYLVTGDHQKDLAERLLAQAKEQGVSLVGPGELPGPVADVTLVDHYNPLVAPERRVLQLEGRGTTL